MTNSRIFVSLLILLISFLVGETRRPLLRFRYDTTRVLSALFRTLFRTLFLTDQLCTLVLSTQLVMQWARQAAAQMK